MTQTLIRYFEKLADGTQTFYCPGCRCRHILDERWTIVNESGAPTVRPSLVVQGFTQLNHQSIQSTRCHLFITNGNTEYCKDSTHELAGRVIPMEDITDH
jgi:hypothetical protein